MRRAAFVLLCFAACQGPPEGGVDNPITPSPGSGASSAPGIVDAGVDAGDAGDGGIVVAGRVCVKSTLFTTTCATTGADNITVTLGTSTATTAADGSFVMTAPVGTGLSFTATGPGIVTTSQALNARAQINALQQSAFDQMVAITGVTTTQGTGSVVATVTNGTGVPISGVTASSIPVSQFGPFFDSTAPMPWSTNATGVNGIVWFPGLVAGPASLSFNTLTGGSAIVGGVQVINGGITMVETPLP